MTIFEVRYIFRHSSFEFCSYRNISKFQNDSKTENFIFVFRLYEITAAALSPSVDFSQPFFIFLFIFGKMTNELSRRIKVQKRRNIFDTAACILKNTRIF